MKTRTAGAPISQNITNKNHNFPTTNTPSHTNINNAG